MGPIAVFVSLLKCTCTIPCCRVGPMIEIYICFLTPWNRVLLKKLTGSQSRNSPHLWKKNVHYRIYKTPPPCPKPEPDQSSPCLPIPFLTIRLNIILPSTLVSSKRSLSLSFPHQNPLCIYPLPHTRYMLHPSNFNYCILFCVVLCLMWQVRRKAENFN